MIGACGFHVDVFIATISPRVAKARKDLIDAFELGSLGEDEFVFFGKHICRDGRTGVIRITAERFIEEAGVKMPPYRGRLEEPPTASEQTEFRSAIGCLQLFVGSARPDLATGTSLLQGSDTRVKHLGEAQRVFKYAKAIADSGLVMNPFPLDELALFAFRDASWANAPWITLSSRIVYCCYIFEGV